MFSHTGASFTANVHWEKKSLSLETRGKYDSIRFDLPPGHCLDPVVDDLRNGIVVYELHIVTIETVQIICVVDVPFATPCDLWD